LLQDIGSNIATPREQSNQVKLTRTQFDKSGELVLEIENWIDTLDVDLPKLTQFILPVSCDLR
jgi:cob(I)alamin adenosyltransferase